MGRVSAVRQHVGVYAKATIILAAVCLATIGSGRLLEARIHSPGTRLIVSFLSVQGGTLLSLSTYILCRRYYLEAKAVVYDRLRPPIQEMVINFAYDGDRALILAPKTADERHLLEEVLADAVSSLRGSARERLARFTLEQGFATRWVKRFSHSNSKERRKSVHLLGLIAPVAGNTILPLALHDPDTTVRTEARRAILANGDQAGAAEVLRSLAGECLLARALVASDLRPYAAQLVRTVVPAMLDSKDEREIECCLQVLSVWQRLLPTLHLTPYLDTRHSSSIRSLALALLSYSSVDVQTEDAVVDCLHDAENQVRRSAVAALSKLHSRDTLKLLLEQVSAETGVAVTAVHAIAALGDEGRSKLESMVAGADRQAAALATEALQHFAVGAH